MGIIANLGGAVNFFRGALANRFTPRPNPQQQALQMQVNELMQQNQMQAIQNQAQARTIRNMQIGAAVLGVTLVSSVCANYFKLRSIGISQRIEGLKNPFEERALLLSSDLETCKLDKDETIEKNENLSNGLALCNEKLKYILDQLREKAK